jgi:H+-transporting ATPase
LQLRSLQGATDAARAASDVVLTESGLSTIVRAVIISRQIVQRMKNYLIYRIACTVQILCFFFFSCLFISPSSYHQEQAAGEPAWPVFFDLPVMSVVIITILNDGTIISIAYDRVRASRLPEVWNMRAITLVSMVIGVIAMASSMLLLHQCLRSNQINSVMHMFGVPFLSYGEIQVSCEQLHMVSRCLGVFEERRSSEC